MEYIHFEAYNHLNTWKLAHFLFYLLFGWNDHSFWSKYSYFPLFELIINQIQCMIYIWRVYIFSIWMFIENAFEFVIKFISIMDHDGGIQIVEELSHLLEGFQHNQRRRFLFNTKEIKLSIVRVVFDVSWLVVWDLALRFFHEQYWYKIKH